MGVRVSTFVLDSVTLYSLVVCIFFQGEDVIVVPSIDFVSVSY